MASLLKPLTGIYDPGLDQGETAFLYLSVAAQSLYLMSCSIDNNAVYYYIILYMRVPPLKDVQHT